MRRESARRGKKERRKLFVFGALFGEALVER